MEETALWAGICQQVIRRRNGSSGDSGVDRIYGEMWLSPPWSWRWPLPKIRRYPGHTRRDDHSSWIVGLGSETTL